MKKSVALASASVLGVGAVALGGTSAQAAPVVDACTTANDHTISYPDIGDNWYMDCIPQYGLGKVEFTIGSDVDLPPEFLPISDPSVASVASNTGPAASTYFGDTAPPAGFRYLDDTSGGAGESYEGPMYLKVSGVQAIPVDDLPVDCTGTYAHAYRVDYLPASVTFTQTIDGKDWTVTVHMTPAPMYLGLNFAPVEVPEPVPAPTTGSLDETAQQCASSGDVTLTAEDSSDAEFAMIEGPAATMSFVPTDGLIATLSPFLGPSSSESIGDFRIVAPQLAETGSDSRGLWFAGGLTLLTGVALSIIGRIRRKSV